MDAAALLDQLNALLALPAESEWVEFKEARESYDFGKLGRYFSALSTKRRWRVASKAGWYSG